MCAGVGGGRNVTGGFVSKTFMPIDEQKFGF
jgi:hypothetical protein